MFIVNKVLSSDPRLFLSCMLLVIIGVIVDHHNLIKIRSPHWRMFFARPLDCDHHCLELSYHNCFYIIVSFWVILWLFFWELSYFNYFQWKGTKYDTYCTYLYMYTRVYTYIRGRCDRMVVGFTMTCAISAYHH